jgi:hypothetical protein
MARIPVIVFTEWTVAGGILDGACVIRKRVQKRFGVIQLRLTEEAPVHGGHVQVEDDGARAPTSSRYPTPRPVPGF